MTENIEDTLKEMERLRAAFLPHVGPGSSSSTAGCRSLTGPQRRAMSRARPRLDFLDRNGTWGLPNNMAMRDLTYRILYEFLPVILSTLVPECEDQFTNEQVEMAGSAAVCLATLLGLPVAFIEYILSVPWSSLNKGLPTAQRARAEESTTRSAAEKTRLINTPLASVLVEPFLNFLYSHEQMCGLPAMIQQCQSESKGDNTLFINRVTPTQESVAALLDRATALHCAALRGSETHCKFFCEMGADTHARTAAGELPMELVPVCGDGQPCSCPWPSPAFDAGPVAARPDESSNPSARRASGAGSTSGTSAAQPPPLRSSPPPCQSRDARTYLAGKMVSSSTGGLWNFLRVLFSCVCCVLGFWGQHATLLRPAIERHMLQREEERRARARAEAQELLERMRSEMSWGNEHLAKAKSLYEQSRRNRDQHGGVAPRGGALAEEAELAFESFVRAVHACQSLELRGGTLPRGFSENSASGAAPGARSDKDVLPPDAHVMEDEQAELYCGWAQSVLLKFRSCRCNGCVSLAAQASRMAHVQVGRLFRRVERKKRRAADRWHAVGCSMATVVYTRCCLLLDTEATKSVSYESIQQAEQCLKDWDALGSAGVLEALSVMRETEKGLAVTCLREWTITGAADMELAVALLGHPPLDASLKPSLNLSETLSRAIGRDFLGNAYLRRPATKDFVAQLEAAIARADNSSGWVKELAVKVTTYAAGEVAAAQALRDIVGKKTSDATPPEAVEMLSKVIDAAAPYHNLAPEISNAVSLRERCQQRAEAISCLEAAMDKARTGIAEEEGGSQDPRDKAMWAKRAECLQDAIKVAQEASVSVSKAKRLHRELQACGAAAEAVERLGRVLAEGAGTNGGRQPGSGTLKGAMSAADEVSSALASVSGSADGSQILEAAVLAEELKELMVQVRNQMAKKKAAEALARVLHSSKGVQDLPKLESAILAARKVGAEELDMGAYQAASELRSKLAEASRAKILLAEKLKGFTRGQRNADVEEAVVKAISDAEGCAPELLELEIRDAKEKLERWRAACSAEAKLAKALRDGNSAPALRRAIQDASAVGSKVGEAKRVLKIMNMLESMLSSEADSQSGGAAGVRTKIQAAEAAGLKGPMMAGAKARLARLLGKDAKDIMDAALKPRGEIARSVDERRSALQAALERSSELVEQQKQLLISASEELGSDGQLADACASVGDSTSTQTPATVPHSARVELEGAQSEAEETCALVEFVRGALEDACREQERAERERVEVERQRREKAEKERVEKEERDRERKEKAELERQAREKAERERKERGRLVAEAADRQRRQRNRKERQMQQRPGPSTACPEEQHTPSSRPTPPPMLAPDAPARYQQGMHRNGEVYDMEREVHIIQTPAAPELHLPSNLMPGMVEVQEEYQQPFQQGFQQVVDNEADGTRVQDPTWGWNPEHLLNSGTEEVTGTGHLQMNKTDSWGQLEMLTKDVLDKLEGPDWEALGMVSDPGIQEIDTFLAADNPEAQELLPVPQNHHPSQQFHVGQDFKSDNTEVVPLPSTSEPNSAAASLDGSPLVKDATPTTIPGPFAHSDRSTFGAGLGGLPLAGIEYGGPSMWGMQSSANGNTSEGVGTSASALPGLSEISLLPADLGLSGPSTGSSMWDTAESLLDTHHRHARSHEQHNMWGGSVFGVPCVGQGSDMQQGLWIAQQPNQQHVRVQGRSARESRERKPQKPTGRVLRVPRMCRYHLQGFCRDGAACRFSHDVQTKAQPAAGVTAARVDPSQVAETALHTAASAMYRQPPPPPPPAARSLKNFHSDSSNSSLASLEQATNKAFESRASKESLSQQSHGDSMFCCVCLEKPREVGLAHENGVLHCCVCRECAERLKSRGFTQCPLCMEKITQFVHRIYL